MRQPNPFHWRGIHHGYLGSWFIAFGAFFLYMNHGNMLDALNWLYLAFVVLGCYLVCDDLYEHVIDINSPMRRLWEWMLRHQAWW